MIAVVAAVWRRLTVGACEDVGTVIEGWNDDRQPTYHARRVVAERVTAALDQALVIGSHLVGPGGTVVVRRIDAETAATLRRERHIAALLAEFRTGRAC